MSRPYVLPRAAPLWGTRAEPHQPAFSSHMSTRGYWPPLSLSMRPCVFLPSLLRAPDAGHCGRLLAHSARPAARPRGLLFQRYSTRASLELQRRIEDVPLERYRNFCIVAHVVRCEHLTSTVRCTTADACAGPWEKHTYNGPQSKRPT